MKTTYIRGCAFYILIYISAGLLNSALMHFGCRILHLPCLVLLVLLILLTMPLLYTAFRFSVKLFVERKDASELKIALAWVFQLLIFIVVATALGAYLRGLPVPGKFLRIITVLVNFVVFFLSYWLSVAFFTREYGYNQGRF